MALYLAADIGGTFTDFVVHDDVTNEIDSFKLFTTYPDRSVGLLAGIDRAVNEHGGDFANLALFSHGSTVATNALVEMKGARCGLITTAGFRDLLELGRQKRPHLYDLQADKPEPLVARALRLEVDERMSYDGTVLRPLSERGVVRAVGELVDQGIESVAVMYLNSYANPDHERRTKAVIADEFPHLEVFLSSDVLPQFREFERLSTTVVNAFISPPIRTYVERLKSELELRGCSVPPLVMKGDAGVATPAEAVAAAVTTIGSGPAGGVMGAHIAAVEAGESRDLITFDMGGTSTDISLVVDGKPLRTDLRRVAGWPLKGSAVDIESIGAGGGSIAWVDEGGLLRVGPQSAGSTPGPACYDRGGRLPTITDANLVLGRLESLLGGEYPLNRELAEEAIREHVAAPLDLELLAAAEGILSVATAHMEQAIRLMTVARGHDPREFVLVTFGGAGALHGPAVARNLGIGRVLVPRTAGVLSARGVLSSNLTKEFSATRVIDLENGLPTIRRLLGELRGEAVTWAGSQHNASLTTGGGRTSGPKANSVAAGSPGAQIALAVDVRCHGQNYELTVPLANGPEDPALGAALAAGFHAAHERAYGYAFTGVSLECVTFRARAEIFGHRAHEDMANVAGREGRGSSGLAAGTEVARASQAHGQRQVSWQAGSAPVATPVYFGFSDAGERVRGPAIIEREDATITVWPGQEARVVAAGAILIDTDVDRGDHRSYLETARVHSDEAAAPIKARQS